MRVTKHHYAIELSKIGYDVYFLEPTVADWKWRSSAFRVRESEAEGVHIVAQDVNIPYNVKFHLKGLFDLFIKGHIRKLENELGPFDLVWSFDLGNVLPLKNFKKAKKKIFFAADWPSNEEAIIAADGADTIVSVAQEILDLYKRFDTANKKLVPHGVADCFFEASKTPYIKTDTQVRVGMSGNFLRPDLDRQILLSIIEAYPEIIFECFGANDPNKSNLGGAADEDTTTFIASLKYFKNVVMHGMVSPETLALELRRMDLFLICYDVAKDQSRGTNYHKVMEYMVYNKPIVSNYVSAYVDMPERVFMPQTSHNLTLPTLFEETLAKLPMQLNTIALKGYAEILGEVLGE